jgi:hypothetical protein
MAIKRGTGFRARDLLGLLENTARDFYWYEKCDINYFLKYFVFKNMLK